MNRKDPPRRGIAITAGILLFFAFVAGLTGCRTTPEPVAAAPEPVPVPEPVDEPEPFLTDWGGTTWILRDSGSGSKEYPGYRGFHLGRDGRLLLINMDRATGDAWSSDGEYLTLTLLDGSGDPDLPVAGRFRPLVPEEDMAAASPGSVFMLLGEVVLEQARVNVDVVENHWIPRSMNRGNTVMWPMSREIHMMLLPDVSGGLGILGYGGENRFRGSVAFSQFEFRPGPLAMTRKIGPASDFERLYVDNIASSNRYVQVEDDLFLYEDTAPRVAFRVRLFD